MFPESKTPFFSELLLSQVIKITNKFFTENGAFLLEKLEVEMMFVKKKLAGVYWDLKPNIPMASFCAKDYLIYH